MSDDLQEQRIDVDAMVDAWDRNISAQHELIRAMRISQADNQLTRRDGRITRAVIFVGSLMWIGSLAWVHVYTSNQSRELRQAVVMNSETGSQLASLNQTVSLVADAVVDSIQAQAALAKVQEISLTTIHSDSDPDDPDIADSISDALEVAKDLRRDVNRSAAKIRVQVAATPGELADAELDLLASDRDGSMAD